MNKIMIAGCAMVVLFSGSQLALAAETKCTMEYNLKSWSIFYKSGKGSGAITCDNGQSARVSIRSKGGGLTAGTSKIIGGHGVFSSTNDIRDLFGSYASAAAHGGAGDAGAAQALTKGDVSLTLTGSGKGINVGIDFGSFKISKQ